MHRTRIIRLVILMLLIALSTSSHAASIMLENYDQATIPVNKEGVTYPTYYNAWPPVGGVFSLSLDATDAAPTSSGQSLLITLQNPSSELYAQFNPYDGRGRGFAHEYAACGYPSACGQATDWRYNTYTKLRFWLKVPTNSASPSYTGQGNCNVGLYNKNVTNANGSVDEGGGGGHFYHSFTVEPTGTWWQVILNMHPDHERGINHVDPGYMPYPTSADPPNTYNYWDTLTRFYLQCGAPAGNPWKLDQIEFYADVAEDDVHLTSALTGTYVQATNQVIVNWERRIPEEGNWDVRYAYSDIHTLGWANATPAPGSPVAPGWCCDYVQVHYASMAIPTTGQSTLYVAVKSQLEPTRFNQIAIPLTPGAPQPPQPPDPPQPPADAEAPSTPQGLTVTTISDSQIGVSWQASTDNVGVVNYRLRRCQTIGCTPGAIVATLPGLTMQDGGLLGSTTYYYTVEALDQAGNVSTPSLASYGTTAPATQPPATPLLLAYAFNEGSGPQTADLSGHGRTGTLHGSSLWTASGKYGNALSFNGSNRWVSVPSSLDLPTLPFTLMAWVKPTDYTGYRNILSKRTGYQTSLMRVDWLLDSGDGHVRLDQPSSHIDFVYKPPKNVWTHLAVVAQASGTQLYVNGVLTQTLGRFTLGNSASASFTIGASEQGKDDWFKGTLDEVRVYTGALTTTEIQAAMNTPL